MTGREVSSFNIVALGPAGAGKTVYLAMLHHAICGDALAEGIEFTIDNLSDQLELMEVYRQVVDPGRDWPDRTTIGQVRKVVFQCRVRHSRGKVRRRGRPDINEHVLDVNYFDYAGELTTTGNRALLGEFQAELNQLVGEVGVVIGVLDGATFHDAIDRGGSGLQRYMDDSVRPIVERMKGHPGPVHFMVTKWDLFEGTSIEELWELLKSTKGIGFRDLVERGGHQVRLIPVSSVGDFAARTAGGDMEKVPGKEPAPQNVDVPLVAAVIDICGLAEAQFRSQAQASSRGARRHRWSLVKRPLKADDDSTVTLGPVKVPVKVVLAFARGGLAVAQELGADAAYVARSLSRQYRRVKTGGLGEVTDNDSALFYVANAFRKRLDGHRHVNSEWTEQQ